MSDILLGLVEIVWIPTEVCPNLLQSAFLREGGIVSEAVSEYIHIYLIMFCFAKYCVP